MSFAAKVLSNRRLRHRHLIGLAFLLLIVVWVFAWILAALHASRSLDRWIDAAKANGTEISYESRYTNGSPFAIHAHLDGLSVTTKNGAGLRAGESVFYINIWNWSDVSVKLRKGIEGRLLSTPFTATGLKFGFTIPKTKPSDHMEIGLSFWVHSFGLAFKPEKPIPFGNMIEEGMINARIMGPIPNFSDKDSLKVWNDLSGVIEFDRLYLRWGPMIVTGNGTLGLDPMLQPEGAFSSRVEGIDAAIANLVANGAIDKRQESLLHSSLHVLSRPSGMTGSSAPIVPFSVQNGGLFLGPVRLLTLSTISW
jgi:hypothetical protein